MKNKQLQPLLQGIDAVGNLSGVRFSYCMSKNRKLITAELETLQEAIKPKEKFLEYDKERIALCQKYADKENGKPKMENNNFVITDRKEFEKEIEKLGKKFNAVLDEREKQGKEFQELLEKESSFVPFKLDYEEIPKDITAKQMDGIIELIKDPDQSKEDLETNKK